MMSVDDTLLCSFQILKPAEKKPKYGYGAGPSPPSLPRLTRRRPLSLVSLNADKALACLSTAVTPPRSKKAITAGKK